MVAWIVLSLLCLLLLFLFVPWTMSFVGDGDGARVTRVQWGPWCFSLGKRDTGGPTAFSGNSDDPQAPASSAVSPSARRGKKRKKGKRRDSGPSFRQVKAFVLSPDLVASLVRLVQRVLYSLRPREVELSVRVGLGDPASTGALLGALAPLMVALDQYGVRSLVVQPDFLHRVGQVCGQGTVRIIPGWLLLMLTGYLFTPAPWRALRRAVDA